MKGLYGLARSGKGENKIYCAQSDIVFGGD